MSRALTVIGIWLFVAGIVLGSITNYRAEECGKPVRVSTDALIASLAWPALLAAAIVVDRDNLASQPCEPGGEK